MTRKRMAVLGAGGIGGSLGGYLTMAGGDVTLIDQWPEHVEAMKANGLRLSTREGDAFDIAVKALHVFEVCTIREPFDLVFLAVKGYDTQWSAKLIEPYLKEDGYIVGCQNGMCDDLIADMVGRDREVPCVVTLTASLGGPGRPSRNNLPDRVAWTVGEQDGNITPRVRELADIMSSVGKSRVSNNIMGERWSKLVMNCMSNSLAGLTKMTTRTMTHDPTARGIAIKLGGEVVRVGEALGYRIGEIRGLPARAFADAAEGRGVRRVEEAMMLQGAKAADETRASLLQDVLKGRKTEVDFLNGYVAARAKEVGVPAPANEAVTALIKRVEAGELAPAASNLELISQELSR